MKHIRTALLVAATFLTSASVSLAETLQLKTGAILVGDVTVLDSGDIRIATRFPSEQTLTLKRADLAPRSLYDLLDRRAYPRDADARLRLGELAESNGLYGLSIADYLSVAELKPELRREMEERVERVREAIAAAILEDARDLLDRGNPNGALMYLHTLQAQYANTAAAKEIKKLMATAHEHAGPSEEVAEKTVPPEDAPKLIASLEKDIEKADGEARKLRGHEGDSSRDQRSAARAIRHYESAWKKVKTLPVAVSDPDLRARIQALRRSTKEKLAQAYLSAGSIQLQRYSIPSAEEYCNKACELQPEDKDNHTLHRLIIEAKIQSGYGWVSG